LGNAIQTVLDKTVGRLNSFLIMNWKKLIIAGVVIVVLILLFFPMQVYWLFYPHTKQDVILQVFKDREVLSVIQFSQSATAQRLHPKNGGGSDTLDGYTKDAPVGLSPQQIKSFQDLLEKPTSYHWGIGNSCIPDYGVLLNFRSEGETVRVAICFKCNMLGVFDGNDDSAKQINSQYIIDPMRPQLIALAKQIFPNDKEIQGLQ
jgi:hypothetical protein